MKRIEEVKNLRRDLDSIVETLRTHKNHTARIEKATKLLGRAIQRLARPLRPQRHFRSRGSRNGT